MPSEAKAGRDIMAEMSLAWAANAAQGPTMGLPFAAQRGVAPVLGSGEDGGKFATPTRFLRPEDAKQQQIEVANGAAWLWNTPLNMASRQRKAVYRARELAGFGDGPITLHVDWGEFGKSLFTWQGGEDEGWITGIPDGMDASVATHGSLFGNRAERRAQEKAERRHR